MSDLSGKTTDTSRSSSSVRVSLWSLLPSLHSTETMTFDGKMMTDGRWETDKVFKTLGTPNNT